MAMPIVYVTRRLPGPALEFLGEHCDVRLWEGGLPPPAEELRRQAADVDGLLTLLTDRIDRGASRQISGQAEAVLQSFRPL